MTPIDKDQRDSAPGSGVTSDILKRIATGTTPPAVAGARGSAEIESAGLFEALRLTAVVIMGSVPGRIGLVLFASAIGLPFPALFAPHLSLLGLTAAGLAVLCIVGLFVIAAVRPLSFVHVSTATQYSPAGAYYRIFAPWLLLPLSVPLYLMLYSDLDTEVGLGTELAVGFVGGLIGLIVGLDAARRTGSQRPWGVVSILTIYLGGLGMVWTPFANIVLDPSPARQLIFRVTGSVPEPGVRSSTYAIDLVGPNGEANSIDTHFSAAVGDRVCELSHPGTLGMKWSQLKMC
jgi:hypothetical protein